MSTAVPQSSTAQQASRWMLGSMVGRSAAMERLFLQMRYLASHLRIALIEGERGTGKRMVAETLHRLVLHSLGPNHGKSFVAAEAKALLSAQAEAAQLSAAAGATLYLAGADALDAEGQLRLLRLIEWVRGPARPLQAAQPEFSAGKAPRLLLVSVHTPLRALTQQGRFRTDLQQQLSLVRLVLPALRERGEDIPVLAEHFAREAAQESGWPWCGFSREASARLASHGWPGNVAELRGAVRRVAARSAAGGVTAAELETSIGAGTARENLLRPGAARMQQQLLRPQIAAPSAESADVLRRSRAVLVEQELAVASLPRVSPRLDVAPAGPREEMNLDCMIRLHVRWVLATANGNKLRAARLLGISRSTLYRLLDGSSAKAADMVTERVKTGQVGLATGA